MHGTNYPELMMDLCTSAYSVYRLVFSNLEFLSFSNFG